MSTNCVAVSTSSTVEEICPSVRGSPLLEAGTWPVDLRSAVLMPAPTLAALRHSYPGVPAAHVPWTAAEYEVRTMPRLNVSGSNPLRGHEYGRVQTVRRHVKL